MGVFFLPPSAIQGLSTISLRCDLREICHLTTPHVTVRPRQRLHLHLIVTAVITMARYISSLWCWPYTAACTDTSV